MYMKYVHTLSTDCTTTIEYWTIPKVLSQGVIFTRDVSRIIYLYKFELLITGHLNIIRDPIEFKYYINFGTCLRFALVH